MLPSNSGVDKNLKALDILLKDKPDDYKGRVLQYVRASGIDADDPTFILLAAQGSLDIALVELPIKLRGIVAQATFNTNGVLRQYSDYVDNKQKEGEATAAKLLDLEQRLDDKITKLLDLEQKFERIPSKTTELVNDAMLDIALANNNHDQYGIDTIVANSNQLVGNLTDIINMHHNDSKIPSIRQISKWTAQQWIAAISLGLILLGGAKLYQVNSNVDQVLVGTVTNNEIVNSIYKKSKQNDIELGRIERYLGIKPNNKK